MAEDDKKLNNTESAPAVDSTSEPLTSKEVVVDERAELDKELDKERDKKASSEKKPPTDEHQPTQASPAQDDMVIDERLETPSFSDTATQDQPPAKGVGLFVVILLALLASAPGAWLFYQASTQPNPLVVVQNKLSKQDSALASMQAQQQRLLDEMPSANDIAGWKSPVAELQSETDQLAEQVGDITSEVQRLAEIDADARKTWQLAEAHYLMRLASQRLIIDRSAEGSVALLNAADNILRDMNDITLFPVRESLADDMTALQQVVPVDQAGIYLRLSSIAKQVLLIPELPANRSVEGERVPTGVEARIQTLSALEEPNFWDKVNLSFWKSVAVVSRHIRVRDHDQAFRPMMSLQHSEVARANIRLSIQQAQLAMLREDEQIYHQSIDQANEMLAAYFPNQIKANTLIEQLNEVKGREVVLELPSIDGSIQVLEKWQTERKANAWRESRGLDQPMAKEGDAS